MKSRLRFIPYLWKGERCGTIGLNTKYNDDYGIPLKTGDIVVFDNGIITHQMVVVEIENSPFMNTIANKTGKGKIIWSCSYEDVRDGDIKDGIAYIKSILTEDRLIRGIVPEPPFESYLYNKEYPRGNAGIIGEAISMSDIHRHPLRVGDVVAVKDKNHTDYDKLIVISESWSWIANMYNELELFKRYEDINDAEVINEFIYIKSIRTRRKLKSGMLK